MANGRSLVMRLRQNHALEHATIHVLSERHRGVQILGRSDFWGFTLLGALSTEEIASASLEALTRLQRGESDLAVHPRCGTNMATSALLVATFSLAALGGKARSRQERFPRLITAALAALMLAQPLGLWMQENITTTPMMAGARIESVMRQGNGRLVSHRVNMV